MVAEWTDAYRLPADVKSQNLLTNTDTQDVSNQAQSAIIAEGETSVLGVPKGGRVIERETWWWNGKVTREKKVAFKK